jgi:hypothetical protein
MPGIAQALGAHACYAENVGPPRNPFVRVVRGIATQGQGHHTSPLARVGGREIRPSHPSGDLTVCHLMTVGHTIVARAMVWLSISKPSRSPLVVAPSPVLASFRAVTVM